MEARYNEEAFIDSEHRLILIGEIFNHIFGSQVDKHLLYPVDNIPPLLQVIVHTLLVRDYHLIALTIDRQLILINRDHPQSITLMEEIQFIMGWYHSRESDQMAILSSDGILRCDWIINIINGVEDKRTLLTPDVISFTIDNKHLYWLDRYGVIGYIESRLIFSCVKSDEWKQLNPITLRHGFLITEDHKAYELNPQLKIGDPVIIATEEIIDICSVLKSILHIGGRMIDFKGNSVKSDGRIAVRFLHEESGNHRGIEFEDGSISLNRSKSSIVGKQYRLFNMEEWLRSIVIVRIPSARSRSQLE